VTPEALRQRLSRARVQLHRLLAATPPRARLVPREELP
jgi:hypothetical protein